MKLLYIRQAINEVLGTDADMMDIERPLNVQAIGNAYRHAYDSSVTDEQIIDYIVQVSGHDFMTYRAAKDSLSPQDTLNRQILDKYYHDKINIFAPMEIQDTDECGKYEPVQYEDVYNLA